VRRSRKTADHAGVRGGVESRLGRWRGARALYREGVGISLVRLDNLITTSERGLGTTCVLESTPGLAVRPARWTIFLSWEGSVFTNDMWHSPHVPMTVRFDPSLIDATLQFVSRLHTAEPDVDHSAQVRQFVARFPRLPAQHRRPTD